VPRKYSMEMRTAAVEETRRRIIDATVQLHNEHGVSATSMQDIADRAGVALATVYRHFPSLDDLVPACGGRNLELNPPPTSSVFETLDAGEDRVRALVQALFTHYERGVRPYEVGFAEAVTLPVMAQLINELGAHIEGLVTAAIAPFNPDRGSQALAVGLCDFRVWRSLTQAGLSSPDAAESVTHLIVTALTTEGARKAG
jgi:AcrR family transcriptional regulator